MFVRYYDEGDPGGKPASADVDPKKGKKEPDGKKLESPEDKPKDKPEGKPKVDDTDYKALHEASEAKLKEFESGVTPKLMKLADYEKAETERQAKTQAAEDDDLVKIDTQIGKIDEQLPLYKADKLDTTALDSNRLTLQNQKKQILSDRANKAVTKEWLDFGDAHPEFTDFPVLQKIQMEAHKRGDTVTPEGAYYIYGKDQEIAKAKESADIDKENKKLGDRALGEDGKRIPEGKEAKSGTTWEFYKNTYGEKRAAELLGIKE